VLQEYFWTKIFGSMLKKSHRIVIECPFFMHTLYLQYIDVEVYKGWVDGWVHNKMNWLSLFLVQKSILFHLCECIICLKSVKHCLFYWLSKSELCMPKWWTNHWALSSDYESYSYLYKPLLFFNNLCSNFQSSPSDANQCWRIWNKTRMCYDLK